jgi:hypothetical protein
MNQAQVDAITEAIGNIGAGVGGRGSRRVTAFTTGDGAEWLTWKKAFTIAAQINGWNDLRQRREACAAIEEPAATLVQDIDQEPAAGGLTIDQYLTACEARFLPESATKYARTEFATGSQNDGEDILRFHARLRGLFVRAFPNEANPNASHVLIDRFIHGLGDYGAQEFTCQQGPQTYAQALVHASNQAATKSSLAANRMGTTRGQGKKRQDGLFQLNSNSSSSGAADNRTCYFCHEVGHIKTSCDAFRRKKLSDSKGDKKGKGAKKTFFKRKSVATVGGEEDEDMEDVSGN